MVTKVSKDGSWKSWENVPGRSWGVPHELKFKEILDIEGKEAAFEFASKYGWNEETFHLRNKF